MTVRAYPAYRESGVEWLGRVPAHWAARRLGFYLAERREKVSDRDFAPLSVTKAGIVPQLDTAAKTDDGDNRKLVRKGDFAINGRSDRKGSSGLSYLDGSVSLINIVLRAVQPVDMRFVQYLLKSVLFQEEFYRFGKGIVADLWSTNYSEMRNIELAVPPPAEQSTLVNFLNRETGKIDVLVAEQERLIALLKEKRQVVISHAVTKGLNPNAPMKDSGVPWLGEVPAHWEVKPLKFVATVQGGVAKGRDLAGIETIEVPYLRVANVQDGYLKLDDVSLMSIGKVELARYLLRKGDILMNEGGDFDKLGRGQIWDAQIDPCIHQNHVFAVRPHSANARWIAMITSADCGRFFFMSKAKQSTNLASISSTNLMELPICCPPAMECEDILSRTEVTLTSLAELHNEATRAITLLRERRAALISAAVTGRIDVRDTIPAAQEAA